jgi:hypothetical protein
MIEKDFQPAEMMVGLSSEERDRFVKEVRLIDRRTQAAEFKMVMGLKRIPREWK